MQPSGKAELIVLLLLVFASAAVVFSLVSAPTGNQTGAFSLSFASAVCQNPPCEGTDDGGNTDGGGGNNGSGTVTPSCPRADDPGTIVCVESYNNKIQCCDEETEKCNCGEGNDSCVGGKCIPKESLCPQPDGRPTETAVCPKSEWKNESETALVGHPERYCCYNPDIQGCVNGSCQLKTSFCGDKKSECISQRATKKNRADWVLGNDFCCYDMTTEVCRTEDQFVQCIPRSLCPTEGKLPCPTVSGLKKPYQEWTSSDFCCYDSKTEDCMGGHCFPDCKKGEQDCFGPSSSEMINKLENWTKWCCPVTSQEESKGILGFPTEKTYFYFCGTHPSECIKTDLGAKRPLKEVENSLCNALTQEHVTVLPLNNPSKSCPACSDPNNRVLYVMIGTGILNQKEFKNYARSYCYDSIQAGCCTFFAYIDTAGELNKLASYYPGCFKEVILNAHGCPKGFFFSGKSIGMGFFEDGPLGNTDMATNLLQASGSLIAVSCNLLQNETQGPLPLQVQKFCSKAAIGSIIKGAASKFYTSICSAQNNYGNLVCYRCTSSTTAEVLSAKDCAKIGSKTMQNEPVSG